MERLFDRYVMVDWSAAKAPKRGRDSIWIASVTGDALDFVRNMPTRHAAMELLQDIARACIASGQRLLAGFDFPFGYPHGVASRFGGGWRAVWAWLADAIDDGVDNRNNSYDVAARLNRDMFPDCADGPFWGHPHQHGGRYPGLLPKKPKGFEAVAEFRHAERSARGAKSLWQLAYNGAVGRQAMTGMARLERLRRDPALQGHCAVWPFETGFDSDLSKPVVLAEIYPSLFPVDVQVGDVKDAAQVRCVATRLAGMDADGRLRRALQRPAAMDDAVARDVLAEEGWIVGAGMAA